ncbi:MAG: hypothetical protein Q9M45_14040 [Robiginitomaculum sp.]|nr:hypothetical protein [Robiginitomaculum sp.]
MSGLSQHISEQRFGRRKVRYALRDGVVAAPTVDAQGQNDEAKTLELRFKDGSVCVADAAQWNIDCHPGDVITQVLLSRGKNKPETLAAVINRTRRERQRVEPLQILLRQAGICRSLYWWVSFVFLSIAAIITERGYFARQIASFISDTEARLFSPLRPLWEMISPLPECGIWLAANARLDGSNIGLVWLAARPWGHFICGSLYSGPDFMVPVFAFYNRATVCFVTVYFKDPPVRIWQRSWSRFMLVCTGLGFAGIYRADKPLPGPVAHGGPAFGNL